MGKYLRKISISSGRNHGKNVKIHGKNGRTSKNWESYGRLAQGSGSHVRECFLKMFHKLDGHFERFMDDGFLFDFENRKQFLSSLD